MMQEVNLGMIGGGTVGSGVYHAWARNGHLMAARLGVKLHFQRIAVKAFDEPRPYEIPSKLMTTNWQEVVNDPDKAAAGIKCRTGIPIREEVDSSSLLRLHPRTQCNRVKFRRKRIDYLAPAFQGS